MATHIHVHYGKTKDAAKFRTLYRTAEVGHSGKVYKVLASNRPTKEETDRDGSLLLLVDSYERWFDIKELHPML